MHLLFFKYINVQRVAILKARLDDQSHLTSKLKWLSLGLFKGGLFVWRDKSFAHSASRGRECPATSTLSVPSLWQWKGGLRPILVLFFCRSKSRNFYVCVYVCVRLETYCHTVHIRYNLIILIILYRMYKMCNLYIN